MTISLGWFIVLCIFGFIGFIATMWFVYLIGYEIGEMITNYKFYKEYYLESQKEFLEKGYIILRVGHLFDKAFMRVMKNE